MVRMMKKTLYLDADQLDRMEALLGEFPGKPSLSSYVSSKFPAMLDELEAVAAKLRPEPLLVDVPKDLEKLPARKSRKSTVKSF